MQDIAHELRTPLTIIRSDIEAMVDGVIPFSQQQLGLLKQDVLRLNRLVNDLHELSVTDNLQLNVRAQQLDLAELLQQVEQRFYARFAAQQKQLTGTYREALVYGDSDSLVQVMNNLLENCLRYTQERASVWLSCYTTEQHAYIRVDDSGPGVKPQHISKLFDRLYREDFSRSRQSGGAGLGLAICKNIIQAHGGEIVARPNQLGGLSMLITLPLTT